jgi:hypothetical protein
MSNASDNPTSIYTEPQAGGLIDFQWLGVVFIFVLTIGSIFEVGLLIYAYVNADKVECNLLWCTFTTERTSAVSQNYMSSSSECYVNGVKINCTDFPTKDYEHFYHNGRFEMNGVCPSPNSNMTIEDCIKEVNK